MFGFGFALLTTKYTFRNICRSPQTKNNRDELGNILHLQKNCDQLWSWCYNNETGEVKTIFFFDLQ